MQYAETEIAGGPNFLEPTPASTTSDSEAGMVVLSSPLMLLYMWVDPSIIALADMFDLLVVVHLLTEVSANGAFKDLHHESEQGPRQCSIPAALRRLIADERMLRLHLQEL